MLGGQKQLCRVSPTGTAPPETRGSLRRAFPSPCPSSVLPSSPQLLGRTVHQRRNATSTVRAVLCGGVSRALEGGQHPWPPPMRCQGHPTTGILKNVYGYCQCPRGGGDRVAPRLRMAAAQGAAETA